MTLPLPLALPLPTDVEQVLWAVAAHGLPTRHRLPVEPMPDADFSTLLGECQRHRLVGLLANAAASGALAVTDRQRADLAGWCRQWNAVEIRVEQLLLQAAHVLVGHGIDFRVIKGAAVAHRWYPDPALRSFGDVDVLLAPGGFTHAATLLADTLGAERAQPEMRSGFDDRLGREILLRVRGLELDLHRTFIGGYYGAVVPLAELFDSTDQVEVGGRALPVLDPVAALLHAGIAAAVGDAQPRAMARRDLLQMSRQLDLGAIEIERMAERARRWRCDGLLALALRESVIALGYSEELPLLRWAQRQPLKRRDRALVAGYRSRHRGAAMHTSLLLAPIGARGRVRLVVDTVLPSGPYRAARRHARSTEAGGSSLTPDGNRDSARGRRSTRLRR